MAIVYLARDVKHERSVALKILNPEIALALGRERFQREIRLAASLQHPHVLSVYDSGETAGRLWFTMPYVRGSLRQRLRRQGRLAIDDAIRPSAIPPARGGKPIQVICEQDDRVLGVRDDFRNWFVHKAV